MTEERISRRQAMSGAGLAAGAVVAAWVAPEILTAKPAGGATLSTPGMGEPLPGANTTPLPPVQGPHAANPLAFTGLNIQRDAEVGAVLIAGGWAMTHWASRIPPPKPVPARPDVS